MKLLLIITTCLGIFSSQINVDEVRVYEKKCYFDNYSERMSFMKDSVFYKVLSDSNSESYKGVWSQRGALVTVELSRVDGVNFHVEFNYELNGGALTPLRVVYHDNSVPDTFTKCVNSPLFIIESKK